MGTPRGVTLSEEQHAFTFLVSEDSDGGGYLSRDDVMIGANQSLPVGQVLGAQVVTSTVSVASVAGTNAGAGALTLASPAVTTDVAAGNYRVVLTDSTHFAVEDPNGALLGEGVVGTAWTDQIAFTIAAGTPDFAAGDSFTVNVQGDEVYVAWNPTVADGSERAKAILGYRAITTDGVPAKSTVINKHAAVRLADLTWNASTTQEQIDLAMRDLGAALIKFR
jgi:hypothetical protein